jgi:hypothetical protein
MEDFTLPSAGASFKKWGVVDPFSQNVGSISKLPYNSFNFYFLKRNKKMEKNRSCNPLGLRPAGNCWSLAGLG